ncbi:MAG: N-acetylmuramic acid 6-phosphate etherase [Acidobacteria bacterium]|nr:N-acetylmuramic acid 6-phosphate etherase [Acidobacteriota bacterium]
MRARRERITERENPASAFLDTKSTRQVLRLIHREDRKVAPAVGKVLPQIGRAVEMIVRALAHGGRLVYLGAGTSGRLGVLDAAECIPTFGTDRVVAVMAGAPEAMFRPTEASEDDPRLAIRDLRRIGFSRRDVLVGISASGQTPYTLGGMRYARRLGAKTIGLSSNPRAALRPLADVAIVPVVGPEVVAGSTRLKAGTAQKLALNMLSTASMVRLGRVFSNWMVNLQSKNRKLRRRAEVILRKAAGVSSAKAAAALQQSDWELPVALLMLRTGLSAQEARRRLSASPDTASVLRQAIAARESSRPAQGSAGTRKSRVTGRRS